LSPITPKSPSIAKADNPPVIVGNLALPPQSESRPRELPKPEPDTPRREPYPWLSFSTYLGDPIRVLAKITIRDDPPTSRSLSGGTMSLSVIDALYVEMTLHRAMIGAAGADVCTYHLERSYYSNNLGPREGLLGFIQLDREVTPISVRASARNGVWSGYVLLRRREGKSVDIEQVIHGIFTQQDGGERKLNIKEISADGRMIRNPGLPDQLSNDLLKTFGIPVLSVDDPRRRSLACPDLMADLR
jgi:hypothetical protein